MMIYSEYNERNELRKRVEDQDAEIARLRGALERVREILMEQRLCTCSECSRPLREIDAALRGVGEGG